MSTVPHVGEGFWSGSTWWEVPETSTHYWVGASPRLSVKDGDGGYARIELGDPYVTHVGAKLAPFTLDETKPLRLNAQVRLTGTWPSGTVFVVGVADPADGIGSAWDEESDLPLGEWVDLSFDIPADDLGGLASAAAAGDLIVHGSGGDVGSTDSWDLSWLEVLSGTALRPLRWRQRSDGLGGGSPAAARGVRTQQGSIRHRGIL